MGMFMPCAEKLPVDLGVLLLNCKAQTQGQLQEQNAAGLTFGVPVVTFFAVKALSACSNLATDCTCSVEKGLVMHLVGSVLLLPSLGVH